MPPKTKPKTPRTRAAAAPELLPPAEIPATRTVKVSVAAVIVNEQGRILFGVRRGPKARGGGRTAVPGGSMEFGETIQAAVEREVLEETGLEVKAMAVSQVHPELFIVNHINRANGGCHFVTIFIECRVVGGKLENREPTKCVGWDWFTVQQLAARLSQEAMTAWQRGESHEDLCWIPLPQLSHYREHLGLQ